MSTKTAKRAQRFANKYITEYLKCKNDFDYFCAKYIKIEMPGKDVPLKPYKKQSELVRKVEKNKHVIVLKSRQIGISTIIQAYSAWLANFYDNVVIGIISKDFKEATDFARTIRGMVEKLPDWMKPQKGTQGRGFAKKTEQSFILTNGAKVYASVVNPNRPGKTLRGKAVTLLVIDEAAFISHVDEAWTSLVPAISTNQMHARKMGVPYGTLILSTPNKTVGDGKWYFSKYQNSVTGDSILAPFIIHWRMIEELASDKNWYKIQCELLDNDARKIAQELELKFLPAEGSFFDADIMEKVQNACIEPIEKLKLFNGEAWKFAEPIDGIHYIIGVDTAPEYGEDRSSITVWNYQTLEQVWEYQGKCKVLDFVKVVQIAATMYPGVIVVESNSYGNQVLEHLNVSEFSAAIYKEKTGVHTLKPGLTNTPKTRPLMIDALYSYINQYPESVKSRRLALELTGLVSKTNGKIEADRGCHDDLALATACCFYVRKYDPPTLIDTARFGNAQELLRDVVDMNISTGYTDKLVNEDVLSHARKKVKDGEGGFVDVMSLYSRE